MFQVRCISRYLSVPRHVIFELGKKDTVVSLSFYRRRNLGRLVRLSTEKNTGLGTQKWVKKEESENI